MGKQVTKHRKGYLYKRGKSGTFYLEYMLGGKRVKKALHDEEGRPITNRRDAETERARIMSPLAVVDPEHVDIKKKTFSEKTEVQLPIDKVWDTYVKSQSRPDSGPRTLNDYQRQTRLFIEWLKENHPKCKYLHKVDYTIAEEYSNYLLNDGKFPKTLRTKKKKLKGEEEKPTPKPAYSMNTFNKHIRVLELVFRILQRKAGIVQNPWKEISRKRENKISRRELTVEEINTIVTKAKGELKALLILGIYTGMRLGDCCTLRWSEVDLHRNIIIRTPNKTARRKNTSVHIPIHPTLLAVLNKIPKSRRKQYVLSGFAAKYKQNDSDIAKTFREHFIACGIQVHKDGTGKGTGTRAVVEVGFHSLRHSFVSLCRQSDTPLAVVEAIVGHSNPAMTRHYTHVGELAASAAVGALPAFTDDTLPTELDQISERDKELLAIIKKSTAKTWKKDREKMTKLIKNQIN